jgi:uncharacterized protein YyaL (SSP411 family)
MVFFLCGCSQSSEKKSKHTNDLIHETSPYLLQHAHNPVNWKAWNKETLALAKKENKLIIVSVGYSPCHWCHVMEEESFENDSVAKIMNEHFINIKVDREERPDVDKVYISAVELMTGNSGWPLNCITLPDGRPVFGGTYFTKEQWLQALNQLVELYQKEPQKMVAYAEQLTQGIQDSKMIVTKNESLSYSKKTLEKAITTFEDYLDDTQGGLKGSQKFPKANTFLFLQRYAHQFKNQDIQLFIEKTLEKMALGGIYDHVGGGFSRYTVDNRWHVPHFEKMLYDNAQLVSLYSQAYSINPKPLYKKVVTETLDFVQQELLNKNGGFYSSLDADSYNTDSEMEEGAYYVWTEEELSKVIKQDYELFTSYYNINAAGLWEDDKYVLYKTQIDADFVKEHHLSQKDLESKVNSWKNALLQARSKRSKPRLDDKILTGWNALMLKAYVDAYHVFQDESYLEIAIQNAEFLLNNQLRKDGGLNRNFKDNKSTINGYAEDYAHLINALISLYEATSNEKWLYKSKELMDYSLENFYDSESQLFYFTSKQDADLISKNLEVFDEAISSSNSVFANNLFLLGHYFLNSDYNTKAQNMLASVTGSIEESPYGFSNWLQLMTNYTDDYFEVAVSGKNAKDYIQKIRKTFIPNILVAGATSESELPLLKNRYNEEGTYIYICTNGTCKLPETDVEKVISKIAIQ